MLTNAPSAARAPVDLIGEVDIDSGRGHVVDPELSRRSVHLTRVYQHLDFIAI